MLGTKMEITQSRMMAIECAMAVLKRKEILGESVSWRQCNIHVEEDSTPERKHITIYIALHQPNPLVVVHCWLEKVRSNDWDSGRVEIEFKSSGAKLVPHAYWCEVGHGIHVYPDSKPSPRKV